MIRASGEPVRGPAFKSRFGPFFFFPYTHFFLNVRDIIYVLNSVTQPVYVEVIFTPWILAACRDEGLGTWAELTALEDCCWL